MAQHTLAYLTARGAQLPTGENDRLAHFETTDRYAISFSADSNQSCIWTIPAIPDGVSSLSFSVKYFTNTSESETVVFSVQTEPLVGGETMLGEIALFSGDNLSDPSPISGFEDELMVATFSVGGSFLSSSMLRMKLTRLSDNESDNFSEAVNVIACDVRAEFESDFENPMTNAGQFIIGGENGIPQIAQHITEESNHVFHQFEDQATLDLTGDDGRVTVTAWNSDVHDNKHNLKIAANDINLECNDLLLGENVSIDSEPLAPVLTIQSPFPSTNYYENTINMQRGTIKCGYTTTYSGIRIESGTANVQITEDGSVEFNDEYLFPETDGSEGQVLATDGAGTLSFANALLNPMTLAGQIIVGGTDGIAESAPGIELNRSSTDNAVTITGTSSAWVTVFGDDVQGTFQANASSDRVDVYSTHNIHIRPGNDSGLCLITGSTRISDAYTLPNTDGAADDVLSTNGSGVVTWVALPTGISATAQTQDDLSDSTGGSASTTLGSIGDTSASDQSSAINNNFASVIAELAKVKADIAALHTATLV